MLRQVRNIMQMRRCSMYITTILLHTYACSHGIEPAGRPGTNPTYCDQGALALPTAPVFRGQRGKCAGRTSSTKKVHGYQQPCGGWGKRHSEGRRHNDGMGPMLSTRPASRQSLSDLMDLNLSLKLDKTGKQGEIRQPRKRSQESTARRSGSRDDGGTAGEEKRTFRRRSSIESRFSRILFNGR